MDKYEKRILTIFICNIIDMVATLFLFSTGLFIELNPVMNFCLQWPIVFVIVKIGVATWICNKMWRYREEKLAQVTINILWIEYLLLAIYYFIICALYFVIF